MVDAIGIWSFLDRNVYIWGK